MCDLGYVRQFDRVISEADAYVGTKVFGPHGWDVRAIAYTENFVKVRDHNGSEALC